MSFMGRFFANRHVEVGVLVSVNTSKQKTNNKGLTYAGQKSFKAKQKRINSGSTTNKTPNILLLCVSLMFFSLAPVSVNSYPVSYI